MSWETTSKAGPVETGSMKVYKAPASGDQSIRSFYCTQTSSTFLPPPKKSNALTRAKTSSDSAGENSRDTTSTGLKVERFQSGYSDNYKPLFNNPSYDPVPHPLELPPYLQRQATVSRRLELEGDVFGSMTKTNFTKPPTPQPEVPVSVSMERTGYTRNAQSIFEDELKDADFKERSFMSSGPSPGSTMLPSMKLEAKKKNAIDAENDFKGPDRFSTTYRAFHTARPLPRGPKLASANEFVTDSILSIGSAEPSGFSRSVIPLSDHQASLKEAEKEEPSKEMIRALSRLPQLKEERAHRENPLIDDATYYEKHPEQAHNFTKKPPTISQLTYHKPPQVTGSEPVPESTEMTLSGYSLNQRPSLGYGFGSGELEEDYGMGHEALGMTQEEIRHVRETDPMEFEYLRNGTTMRSVYKVSYPGHSVGGRGDDELQSPPAMTRAFGTGSNGMRFASDAERKAYVGSMKARHLGIGTGNVLSATARSMGTTRESIPTLRKEHTGYSDNTAPSFRAREFRSEPLYLTPQQQTAAMVSKRLDYEGDVKTSIYKSDFKAPVKQKEERREFWNKTSIGRRSGSSDYNSDYTSGLGDTAAGARSFDTYSPPATAPSSYSSSYSSSSPPSSSSSRTRMMSTSQLSPALSERLALTMSRSGMKTSSQIGLGAASGLTPRSPLSSGLTTRSCHLESTMPQIKTKDASAIFTRPDDFIPSSVEIEKSGYTRSIGRNPILQN
ncbi:uncharacterized protein MONOS_4035 [Monocercomonoides exilis]|uniref:uncharacterized protein n=1 Tax=Monocercomonoides exilis TaxID=2049356 RepID=UPI003559B537|nr:hypothetical protein MONOS_4035 [Monocercomonoides exilis]|eukprot:MONOS_4035.1-p1 / transcript=MONOS_4035.1 / gene=MONOS_4035 / organism=Monocercomonoides_exilis_PA203 / gene_product=unspecified product / transcript_product=unspecified product / location=Mono_scaffold00102:50516-52869(-) / protein_length=727 / sequence_SO=supercontig / SO=protein_coding / is_pseudo=false